MKPVIISNRGPSVKSLEKLVLDPAGGGLQNVLADIAKDSVWISLCMTDDEREIFIRHSKRTFPWGDSKITLSKPAVDTDTYDGHYRFSNGLPWPLFHLTYRRLDKIIESFPTPKFNWDDFMAYRKVNRIISEFALDEVLENSSRPLVFHDFHMLLAMKYLRDTTERLKLAKYGDIKLPPIGFFLHTPFFDIDLIEEDLFRDKHINAFISDVVDSICSVDLAGFQIDVHKDLFEKLVRKKYSDKYEVREEGDFKIIKNKLTGHETKLGVYTVGVDLEHIRKVVSGKPLPQYHHSTIGGQKVNLADDIMRFRAMGVDIGVQGGRSDYTKLFENGAHVFGYLNQIGLPIRGYTIAAESRTQLEAYRKLHSIYKRDNRIVNAEHKLKLRHDGRTRSYAPSIFFTRPSDYDELLKLHLWEYLSLSLTANDGCCLYFIETIESRRNNREGLVVAGISGAAERLRREGLGPRNGLLFVSDPTNASQTAREIYQVRKELDHPYLDDRLFRAVERRFDIQKSHVEPFFRDLETCRK